MRLVIAIILIVFLSESYSQVNKQGIPFLRNYTPKEYGANEQNWAVVQDNRGFLYVGNQENGVLEYDGIEWRRITLPNNSSIRSLAVDSLGNIFVGAVRELGLLVPNELGFMEYKSLMPLIDSTNSNFGDVWRTYTNQDEVYFTTRSKIFKYDYKKISIIELPENPFFSFLVDGELYCGSVLSGLNIYKPDFGAFQIANGGEFYQGKNILSVLPYDDSRLIVGTHATGCFLYNKTVGLSDYLPEPTQNNEFFIDNGIYHGVQIQNNLYGYATMYKGFSVIDNFGNLIYQLDRTNGLQEDMVSFVFSNNRINGSPVWITLSNGISKLEISSPINVFNDITGINDIISYGHNLYISTDVGVFCREFNELGLPEFKKIEDFTGTSWSIHILENESDPILKSLIFSAADGIYKIENKKTRKLITRKDCRTIYAPNNFANTLFIGTIKGLVLVSKENDRWVDKGSFGDFKYEVHSINEDSTGNIWIGTYLNGLLKINKTDTSFIKFGIEHGLPSLKSIRIAKINNQLIFATEKGLFQYFEKENNFKPTEIFDKSFSDGSKGVLKLILDRNGKIWSISFAENEYWIEMFTRAYGDNYTLVSKPFKRLPNMTFQSVYTDENNITWIGGSKGLYSFDNSFERLYEQKYFSYIRKVIVRQDSVIFGGTNFEIGKDSIPIIVNYQNLDKIPEIKYINNSLSFEFASPFFENEDANKFSWQLEGFDKNWNHWSNESKAFYTNLFEGNYTFKIKAKNIYGTESEIASYKFRISPPWYRTYLAYLTYLIVFVILIRFLIKLNVRRLEKEKIRLEGIVRERTAEVVSQKEKIEKAYENVKMLSKIGQDVTANLSVEKIVEIVYNNVNTLMEASIFALGIYNQQKESLDFFGKEENIDDLIRTDDPLENEKLLSVWCYKKQKEIFIDHFSEDNKLFEIYGSGTDFQQRESLIYLPLTTKDKKIGILTVQSFTPKVYTDYHLNILKNLAVYTSIALDNADAYGRIEAQKQEIIEQRDEIEAQRDFVTKQRDQIAWQKKNITDSIQYAKRIQNAVLPPDEQISKGLAKHFILFRPRDIVSGDFYWMRQINEFTIITAADCTGHGVPGAFMSMLGVSFLNEIIRRHDVTKAHHVLNELRKYVKASLRQTGKEGEAKDGMDISLCVINRKEMKLQYAGAYNPLYHYRNSELTVYKADKMPIGIHINEKHTFTNHEIDIEEGDVIYMFSDGYVDQFGGPDGRKFKVRRFKELLQNIHHLTMGEQKQILDKTLIDWMGTNEQIDDITVIGVRI